MKSANTVKYSFDVSDGDHWEKAQRALALARQHGLINDLAVPQTLYDCIDQYLEFRDAESLAAFLATAEFAEEPHRPRQAELDHWCKGVAG